MLLKCAANRRVQARQDLLALRDEFLEFFEDLTGAVDTSALRALGQ